MGREIAKEDDPNHSAQGFRPVLYLGIAAYVLVVAVPAMIATYYVKVPLTTEIVNYAFTISGILGYAIISMQFVLAARLRWIERLFGYQPVFQFHKVMAVIATLLVVTHVTLLVWIRGNWHLVLGLWLSWPVQLGRATIVLIFAILAMSFGRKYLPINNADWLWFHSLLAWSVLIMGFLHSIMMGENFENQSFAMLWTGYFVIAILAWSWKKLRRIRKTTES